MQRLQLNLFLRGAIPFAALSGIASAQGVPTIYGPGQTANAYANTLRVTPFATGLSFPTSMQAYGTGSDAGILVGTTNAAGFNSTGQTGKLLLLRDQNHDGKAEPDQTVDLTPAGGLPGGICSVRQAGNLVFVTSAGTSTISVLRVGATATTPMTSVGSISFAFPVGTLHYTYALAVRPTPGVAGKSDVLFNIGSQFNDKSSSDPVTLNSRGQVTGLNQTALAPESIYKMTVTDSGSAASLSAPVQIAKGLRNAAGIAFQPGTGDLYFQDNGMDGNNDNGHPSDIFGNVSYSLDTLHRIPAAQIGATVPDYNFSQDFYENTSPVKKYGDPQALAAFAPLEQYSESEGADEIAFAPAKFPGGVNNGVFIGFHGQFNSVGDPDAATRSGNEEHPVVYYDASTGNYFHFIDEANPGVTIGHLDGLLSTDDALYLSDIAAGNLFGGGATGAIYQISAVPEPTTLTALVAGLALFSARRRTRNRAC